jgi:hypothetical protein
VCENHIARLHDDQENVFTSYQGTAFLIRQHTLASCSELFQCNWHIWRHTAILQVVATAATDDEAHYTENLAKFGLEGRRSLNLLFAPQAVLRVPVRSVDMARNAQLGTEQLLAAGSAADVAGDYGAAGAAGAEASCECSKAIQLSMCEHQLAVILRKFPGPHST